MKAFFIIVLIGCSALAHSGILWSDLPKEIQLHIPQDIKGFLFINGTYYYQKKRGLDIYYYEPELNLNGRLDVGGVCKDDVCNDKPVIVTIHGGPGGNWFRLRKGLEDKLLEDYHFVTYDQRGAGSSKNNVPDMMDCRAIHIQKDLNDLLAIVKMTSHNKKVNLIASSHGGVIAQLFLSYFPELVDKALFLMPIIDYTYYTKGLNQKKNMKISLPDNYWRDHKDFLSALDVYAMEGEDKLLPHFEKDLEDFKKALPELAGNVSLYQRSFIQTPLSPEALEFMFVFKAEYSGMKARDLVKGLVNKDKKAFDELITLHLF